MSESDDRANGRAGWVPLGDTLDFLPSEHDQFGADPELEALDGALDELWADEPTDVRRSIQETSPREAVATARWQGGAAAVHAPSDPFADLEYDDGGDEVVATPDPTPERAPSRPRYRPDPELVATMRRAPMPESVATAEYSAVDEAQATRRSAPSRSADAVEAVRFQHVTAERDPVPRDFVDAAILRTPTDSRRRPAPARGPERTLDRDLESLLADYVEDRPSTDHGAQSRQRHGRIRRGVNGSGGR